MHQIGLCESGVAALVMAPARGTCDDCGEAFESHDPILGCLHCGSVRITHDGGDDLVLESIRYRPPSADGEER